MSRLDGQRHGRGEALVIGCALDWEYIVCPGSGSIQLAIPVELESRTPCCPLRVRSCIALLQHGKFIAHSTTYNEYSHLLGYRSTDPTRPCQTHRQHTFNHMLSGRPAPCNQCRGENQCKRRVFYHFPLHLGMFSSIHLYYICVTSHSRTRPLYRQRCTCRVGTRSTHQCRSITDCCIQGYNPPPFYSLVELVFRCAWDSGTRRSRMQKRSMLLHSRVYAH